MSSTPESGDIHDVSHVVSFLSSAQSAESLTLEELKVEALRDERLQSALATLIRRAEQIFGRVRQVTFMADPEIEGRTYYVIDAPVRGTVDEISALEDEWIRQIAGDNIIDLIPRIVLHLSFQE